MSKNLTSLNRQSGNAVVIVLVILVVVAVGALAFLSGKMSGEQTPADNAVAQAPANTSTSTANAAEAPDQAADSSNNEAADFIVEPGNPVVAKVGDSEIVRNDVISFIQTLPAETQQLPPQQIFPMALDQVVNARMVAQKSEGANLENDPAFKEQLEMAKEQITQRVFVENAVNRKLTDERLKAAYDEYVTNFPKVEEIKAAHILIEDEADAKAVLAELKEGGDFAALAREHSTDRTAENGGDLGYFLKTDVVPEFGEAAFALEPGSYTQDLVKSQFGYHIIKVEDKRMREPVDFETAKPLLQTQLRQVAFQEVLNDWSNELNVQKFDVNGNPITENEQASQ